MPVIPKDYTHSFMMYALVLRPLLTATTCCCSWRITTSRRGIFSRYCRTRVSKLFPGLAAQYPEAQRLAERGFFVGMHQGLTKEDMDYLADTIISYFEK